MSSFDKTKIPDEVINEQGPPIVSGVAAGCGGCCPPCPPCPPHPCPSPTPGDSGVYITQVYASKDNDGGVEINRKGSAVSISHKKYETEETFVEKAAQIVSDIEVKNGHVTKIETTTLGDEIATIVEEKVKEILPDVLEAKVPEIMEEHLPEALVNGDTLLNALNTNDILFNALLDLDTDISGGRAPKYD